MIVCRTPFRLPLGGGGTDLPFYYREHGGFLVTASLGIYMYLCINEPVMVNKIKINYSKVEIVDVDQVDSIKHDIVRETLKYFGLKRPLEISSMSDISAGTGLGSSSSYTVGLLNGLNVLLKRQLSAQELAEEACKVEMDLIGKPIGKQDQYAAAYGGIITMDLNSEGEVKVTQLNLKPEIIQKLEQRLLIFYTQIERDAGVILGEQQRIISTRRKKNILSVDNQSLLAMHNIKKIGFQIRDALLDGDMQAFGELMHQHWLEKKQITKHMSSPQIDGWYEVATNNGAIGGKIMGAGGGGFFVFCCEEGKRDHLREKMEQVGLKYTPFTIDFEGSKVLGSF